MFLAFWAHALVMDGSGTWVAIPKDEVRGQVFHADLDAWIARDEADGGTVTVVRIPSPARVDQ